MSSNVSVARCILDGAVVSLLRVRLELEVTSGLEIFGREAKVDEEDVVFFAFAKAEEQVLSFNVIVDVTLCKKYELQY